MKKFTGIVRIVAAALVVLSIAALVTVNIIGSRENTYDGRYIYASDEKTRIFDMKDNGDSVHFVYTISDDEGNVNNTYDAEEVIDDYYIDSLYGWAGTGTTRYAELEFDVPKEIIPKGVQVSLYDSNRYELDNLYMYIGGDNIFFWDDCDVEATGNSGEEASELHTLNDFISWNKAERVRTDYSAELMIVKIIAVAFFTLASSLAVVFSFKKMRRGLYTALCAAVVILTAIAYVFLLKPELGGEYTVDGDNAGVGTVDIINYGSSCIMMGANEERCLPTEFEKNGTYYSASGEKYIQDTFRVSVNSSSECELRLTTDGAKFTVYNRITESYFRFDFYKDKLYTVAWLARYIVWLAAIAAIVFMIIGMKTDADRRKLEPEYPYGDYRIKRLAYLDASMEYMRKYLRDNMEGVPVTWHKDLFAVDNVADNNPEYVFNRTSSVGTELTGRGNTRQVDVSKDYCIIYSNNRKFLGTMADNRVYTVYELEEVHE